MPLSQMDTNPPTLDDFALTEASIAEAREVIHRHNNRVLFILASIGILILLGSFAYALATYDNAFGAVVAWVLFGIPFACFVWIWVVMLLMLLMRRMGPTQPSKTIERFEQFSHAITTYETEQRRRQADYWLCLSPTDFEREVAALLARFGMRARVTPASGDEGIDIRVEGNGRRAVVQCKRYAARTTPALVRELYGALTADGADMAMLVCTGGFTSGAHAFASGKPIHLINLNGILRLVEFTRGQDAKSGCASFAELLAIAGTAI